MVNQIRIMPVRERVASELRKAILTEAFPPGTELTQSKIAEMLGVSRMPVREAIQMLSSEGLIEMRPNRSAIVQQVPDAFIRDHFDLRILLECEAAARACVNITDFNPLLEVHAHHKESVESGQMEDIQNTNQSFHMLLWDAAGNSRLKNLLMQLWNGVAISRPSDSILHLHDEHDQIVEAVMNQDPESARDAMKKHLERSMQDILNRQIYQKK
ncbi:MAG: GntR family transcriptional regulator [Tindallia sp. MSAO_Bac2]|nr:MAG: GntR family transcriptional regulator [Tindallia sp. MSAO_Bac2]